MQKSIPYSIHRCTCILIYKHVQTFLHRTIHNAPRIYDSLTWRCDKDVGSVDHTHMTIEGGPVESLSGEGNRGNGERSIVGDGNS